MTMTDYWPDGDRSAVVGGPGRYRSVAGRRRGVPGHQERRRRLLSSATTRATAAAQSAVGTACGDLETSSSSSSSSLSAFWIRYLMNRTISHCEGVWRRERPIKGEKT